MVIKTYRSKEATPLKFHKFIWFVWMPLSFLVAIYNAWEAIFEFWEICFATAETLLHLIFIFECLMEGAFVVAPLLIFVGFFKWKSYAWYILMFLSLSNVICSSGFLLFSTEYEDLASLLGRFSGILIDLVILFYYWNRRVLFNVRRRKNGALKEDQIRKDEIFYCHSCGNRVQAGSKFCNLCGVKLGGI